MEHVHCAGGAMNSIGGGAVGGSNGCAVTGGAVGGAEAMQQYGAGAATGLSGLLNPGMLLLLTVFLFADFIDTLLC